MAMGNPLFPRWIDRLRPLAGVALAVLPVYLVGLVYYVGSPQTTELGYAPEQPVPFSHAQHAGDLGIDCRYCHNTVDRAAYAAVPPTQTCLNCHERIWVDSPKLLPVHESLASGKSVPWVKVHDLPDYAYFDHRAHVGRGVGCVSCHGRVDTMERITQVKTLTMSWCLDCHRNPEPNLRPLDTITQMTWVPEEDPSLLGARLRKEYKINPSTNCSTCHR